jgi:cephalosporin hydroxylase
MTILEKVLRRLARIEALSAPAHALENKIYERSFFADTERVSALANEYSKCTNIDDFYALSSKFLDPGQISSEIKSFLAFANEKNPQTVCEIGIAFGGTNFLLREAISSVREIIGMDHCVRNSKLITHFKRPSTKVHFISGDSHSEQTRSKLGSYLSSRKLDLLFIDGDHSYDGVKQDFLMYKEYVREEGIIVFHDVIADFHQRFGQQTGRDSGGVPKFWQEVKQEYEHYEFVESQDQDGFGIGVIIYERHKDLAFS